MQPFEDATWFVAKSGALSLAHGLSFSGPKWAWPCAPHPQPIWLKLPCLTDGPFASLCFGLVAGCPRETIISREKGNGIATSIDS